jgi:hypothetical protein
MPIMEECISNDFVQIVVDYTAPQTLNPDLHEETLMHPYFQGVMHIASDFEDVRLQFDHHKLQESSEKEEVVLEPLAHDDLPPGSENEESVEEEQFVPDPMDVHIFSIDNMVPQTQIFKNKLPFLLILLKTLFPICCSHQGR